MDVSVGVEVGVGVLVPVGVGVNVANLARRVTEAVSSEESKAPIKVETTSPKMLSGSGVALARRLNSSTE